MPNALSIEPALRERTIALVGLMGVGKSSIGRRLANALDLPFRDADAEVEARRRPLDLRHLRRPGRGRLPRRRAPGDRAPAGRAAARAGHRRRRLHEPRDPRADQGQGHLGLAEGRPGGAGPPGRRARTPGRCWPARTRWRCCRPRPRRAIRSTPRPTSSVETGDAAHHVDRRPGDLDALCAPSSRSAAHDAAPSPWAWARAPMRW